MCTPFIIVLLLICNIAPLLVVATDQIVSGQGANRSKRGLPLIFPRTAPTRIQWIVGVGIPLEDLTFEALTTGYVLKAEYFLPYTAEQLRIKTTMPLTARKNGMMQGNTTTSWFDNLLHSLDNSTAVLSSYRWAVYKSLAHLAQRANLQGNTCVLKSICEAAQVDFHYGNGVFGELLHILLTPSSSMDEISEDADNEYFHAEFLGRSGGDCDSVFRKCPTSLLAHITSVNTLENLIG